MSSLLDAVIEATDHKTCKNVSVRHNNKSNNVKLTTNALKHKCSKKLKVKLRKYKVRKNGEEDQDVLDISKTIVSTLTIKSPSCQNSPPYNCLTDLKPRNNYLFRNMGKRRKCNILNDSNRVVEVLTTKTTSAPENSSQENSATNAFRLMMESRHKSIGTNSPGKDRPTSDTESQENVEKRETKARRMLSLQKMSEAKGSLKNKEIEEYRDRCVKRQILKRAEKFKVMITHDNSEATHKTKENSNVEKYCLTKDEIIDDTDTCVIDVKKTLQLCNMFEQSDAEVHSNKQLIKKISHEDKEFLSKLSPSIRKKENMMSYFQKVPKSPEEDDLLPSDENSQDIIKVKFKTKHKKKKISKKTNKERLDNRLNKIEEIVIKSNSDQNPSKCKEDKILESTVVNLNSVLDDCEVLNDETRPKRKTKRPAKYVDDIELFSSDEELTIFTPKKKKNLGKMERYIESDQAVSRFKDEMLSKDTNLKRTNKTTKNTKSEETESCYTKKDSKSRTKNTKNKEVQLSNPIKLAPIFVSKQINLSTKEKEARQKFLQSGIPEKLRKSSSQRQNSINVVDNFHCVVHIQQSLSNISSRNEVNFPILDDLDKEHTNYKLNESFFKKLINQNQKDKLNISFHQNNKEELLHIIKKSYQKFPVYRTYHLLKGKSRGEYRDYNYPDLDNSVEIINGLTSTDCDSIDKLCWVDKYKPTSTKQIIGNFTAIDELKKWLEAWTENVVRTKNGVDSEGSDFDDFQNSDADSREGLKSFNNILIISGEVGSGKTSSVYAVAAELAIKVIEVNASSKRTGKKMLQDLQEATRSHKVDRAKSNLENSKKNHQVFKTKSTSKKRGRPKKLKKDSSKDNNEHLNKCGFIEQSSSQESVRTHSSLILIDDADIVFEQDDGFCSAVSQLIQSSKRPVILVTSSLSCQHLQRFIQYGKIINMHKYLPKMLGIWLDIMCLADIGTCYPGLGNCLLDYYKGDIRKAIHCLQFYMASYKHTSREEISASQDATDTLNIEDENSSLSWTDHECNSLKNTFSLSDVTKNLIQQYVNIVCVGSPLDLLSIWWSLPKMYYDNKEVKEHRIRCSKQLNNLSDMLSIISEADFYTQNSVNDNLTNIWYPKEMASLNESENFEYYNRNKEVSYEISYELAMLGLSHTQNISRNEISIDLSSPGYAIEREQNKIVSRHNTLTSYLNPGVILDRRALALDYWSSCRTICRFEKNKTDINMKRNNRFCHYLKSLNVLCKNDYFDALSKSLNNSECNELL